MPDITRIPPSNVPFVGAQGWIDTAWYRYLHNLQTQTGDAKGGVMWGDGAPTMTPAIGGILYINRQGSTTNDRAFLSKTDGTWAAVLTES